ncbi:MAG: DUF1080 domain-containing protein [Pseudomonadota bacterium]
MNANRFFKVVAAGLLLVPALYSVAAEEWKNMSGSFDGWRQVGDANWRIENGEFVADMGRGFLVTQDTFTDMHIKLEFYANDGKANSGVYFRINNPDAITDSTAYEANIIDERPDQTGRTGGIPNYAPPSEIVNAGGKWNTYDITVQGDHIVVIINGIKTVDVHDTTHKSGPLALQYGAGTIKFKNIQLMKL